MGDLLEITRGLGNLGIALLAIVLALWLGLRLVALFRTLYQNGNGGKRLNGNGIPRGLEGLRMICPVAGGRTSLEDLYDVLVELRGEMRTQNKQQESLIKELREQGKCFTELRVELAERGNRQ